MATNPDDVGSDLVTFPTPEWTRDQFNAYWWSKTPEQRFCALEVLRRLVYGYGRDARMHKTLEVVRSETT